MERVEVQRWTGAALEAGADDVAGDCAQHGRALPFLQKYLQSGEIARQRLLEFRKIARDGSDIEAPENRRIRLAVEQKAERRLNTLLCRLRSCPELRVRRQRHRHGVVRFGPGLPDNHVELERIVASAASDRDLIHPVHPIRISLITPEPNYW